MNPNGQVFGDTRPTAGALLRRAGWINLDHTTPSIFRFVGREAYQLIPGGIRNTLGQKWMLNHPHDIQVLKDNHAEALHEPTTQFVGEVAASVRNPVVHLAQRAFVKLTFGRPLRIPADAALHPRQVVLVTPKEARVGDLLAGRKCNEVQQAQVDADRWSGMGFCRRLGQIAGGNQVPVVAAARERERLDDTRDGTMEQYANMSDVLEVHAVAVQLAAIAVLWEVHRVESVASLEARVPWFKSGVDAPKEVLKRSFETAQGGLTAGEIGSGQVGMGRAVQLQLCRLVFVVDAAAFLLPGSFSFLERAVIQVPVGVQHLVHRAGLLARRQQAIAERSSHIWNTNPYV